MQPATADKSAAAHSTVRSEKNERPVGKNSSRMAWLGLCVILALYVWSAWRVGPVSNFGVEGDDAVYFASAKALASGQGYILPSFPERLAGTKYPELYPLLLAGIWKLDPSFPSNVNAAVALTLIFGCAALVFAFLLLRNWPGFGEWDALGVVALCGFAGYFLDLSASVLTDVPFMALMLGAIWLAERGMKSRDQKSNEWASSGQKHTGRRWEIGKPRMHVPLAMMLGAGALAGASVGFRTLGAAIVAGIGLVLLMRRQFGKLVWFSLAAAPISLVMAWPQIAAMAHPSATSLASGPGNSGWTHTLCYYTSYACNWRLDTTGPGALWAVIRTNLGHVIEQPGLYLLFPLGDWQSLGGLVLLAVVSIMSYSGILRYARVSGWQPLPVVFLFYLLVIVPWPYTPDRFLVPFLPLLIGGFWLEGLHLVRLLAGHLRSRRGTTERAAAAIIALAALGICGVVAVNYTYTVPVYIGGIAAGNRRQLAEEQGAFRWIRLHTSPDARIVAMGAELIYLYTGRRGMAPIIGRTQEFYLREPWYTGWDAAHLGDVARHIHASYWVGSVETFRWDSDSERRTMIRAEQKLLAGAPVVYQSDEDAVRIYDVRCMTGAKSRGCPGETGGN